MSLSRRKTDNKRTAALSRHAGASGSSGGRCLWQPAASVRVWRIMPRGRGPWTQRAPPERVSGAFALRVGYIMATGAHCARTLFLGSFRLLGRCRCGSGSWGGQRLRMAPYVTGRDPRTERAGNSLESAWWTANAHPNLAQASVTEIVIHVKQHDAIGRNMALRGPCTFDIATSREGE